MKVTVDLSTIRKALATAKKAQGTNTYLPALHGARLDASGDTVTVTATDLDTAVTVTVPATVHDSGTCLVNLAGLAGTVKGKGEATIVHDGDTVTVTGATTSVLPALSLEEYPAPLAGDGDGDTFYLDLSAVAEVAVAASTDQARPILCGVMFDGEDITSTDSYRLHTVNVPGANYPATNVPAKMLIAAAKSADTGTITFNGDTVTVVAGNTVWTARAYTFGDFPAWRKLVPSSTPAWFTVQRDTFAALIDAVRPKGAGVKKPHATPVRLTFEGHSIVATVTDTATRTGQAGATWNMPGVPTVAFNGAFLLEAVKATHGAMVTVAVTDALKPGLIVDTRPGLTFTALLMPVRV